MENNKKKKKILVVDDDRSILDLMQRMLQTAGFEPILAQSGEEFREKAFAENPDMIVLDIVLSNNEDGTKIYESLVAEGLSKEIPVLFLSGLAEDLDPTFPRAGHRFALVGKPFDSKKLIHELQTALNVSS